MKPSYVTLEGDKPTIVKRTTAGRVYGVDLIDELAPNDLPISVVCTASGVTAGVPRIDGTKLLVFLTGGVDGELASCKFAYSTVGGENDHRTIYLRIVLH